MTGDTVSSNVMMPLYKTSLLLNAWRMDYKIEHIVIS